jgi:hypothetical protein
MLNLSRILHKCQLVRPNGVTTTTRACHVAASWPSYPLLHVPELYLLQVVTYERNREGSKKIKLIDVQTIAAVQLPL